MKKYTLALLLIVITLIVVACGNTTVPTRAATPVPTFVSQPTVISLPTKQPTVTPTPFPTPDATPVPFTLIGVDLTVNPSSIAGVSCGTTITLTYTATFRVQPGSSGGAILFVYTVNNGRSTTSSGIGVTAGQTQVYAMFKATGKVTRDHTFPGVAEVISTDPNRLSSLPTDPSGECL